MDYQAPLRKRELIAANDEAAPPLRVTQQMGAGHSHFEIYRTDEVSLTSTLFGGGDWHWRLTDSGGALLADCGGFASLEACRAAVMSIRAEASTAALHEQD